MMWQHCGPVRDGEGLALAQRLLDELAEGWTPRLAAWGGSSYVYELGEAFEVRNMVRLAAMVVAAAAARRESRGHHFRSDYPESDPAWQRHTLVRRDAGGGPGLATAPVVTKVPHWRGNHD
jgi:fumarate reductase (CoM/CoB) subunit A